MNAPTSIFFLVALTSCGVADDRLNRTNGSDPAFVQATPIVVGPVNEATLRKAFERELRRRSGGPAAVIVECGPSECRISALVSPGRAGAAVRDELLTGGLERLALEIGLFPLRPAGIVGPEEAPTLSLVVARPPLRTG